MVLDLWAVVLKERGIFIGDCGITMLKFNGETLPEIGYHINKAYTRNGYASGAAVSCKEYAFNALKLPGIYSYMKYTNIASEKTAVRIGVKFITE